MRNWKRNIIITLSLFLGLLILYFWYIAPQTPLRRIIIQANFDISEHDIYNITQLRIGMPMMSVDTANIKELLEAEGMIHQIHEVRRGWFGQLYLHLSGYNPSVALLTPEGRMLLLDENGFIFNSDRTTGIFPPLLSGAILEVNEMGDLHIHPTMLPLLRALTKLKEYHPEMHSMISGFRSVTRENNLLYWELTIIGLETRAMLAGYVRAEDIQRAILVLNILESQGRFLEMVDFRTNEIVF